MTSLESYPLPHSALLFMAAVDEARATQEGPFRAVAPVFRLALESQRGQLLNMNRAASVLQPILGGNFTEHALEAFLPHLTKLGWLVEERASDNESAYRVPATLPEFDQQEAAEASLAKLERLRGAFDLFLDQHAPLLKITLNAQEFQWQLFKWATSLDGSDKAAVLAEAERLVAGGKPSARQAFLDEPQRFSRVDKHLNVEFAGFTKWLAKERRAELADIASLTELGLALEFLQELQRPSGSETIEVATTFVLDAPVLLDLLGLSGPSRKASIERCLAVVRDHGGKITTLAHCLEELSDILLAVLDRPLARRFGLTGDAIREDPKLAGRALQVARQPDQAVKLFGVEVLMFDRHSPLYAANFPDPLVDRFRIAATWHDQYKTEQRDRDAMSIAFVMRRRQGRVTSEIFQTPFVLVTRNSTFTQFSQLFVRTNLGTPEYALGPAIETKTLAAIVWMRFGSAAAPDLPQIHLISACDRILASNGEILRKAERRLIELQGEDGASILLSSQQAVLDLVISVGGSPDVLDAANAEQLLHAFTTSAEARGREDERRKAEEAKAQYDGALAERDRDVQELTEKATTLASEKLREEARRREAEETLARQERADQDRLEQLAAAIAEKTERQSWRWVIAVWAGSLLFGIGGQFFVWRGTDWWHERPSHFVAGLVVILCSLLAAALSLRWVPPGRIDLAGVLHLRLARGMTRRRLQAIEPVEDRNRVNDELEKRGCL